MCIITQKNYQSLMDHVGSGKEWDLSRKTDGFSPCRRLTPENTGIYRGLSDAIRGSMPYQAHGSRTACW